MFRLLVGSISCALVLAVFPANANESRRASFDPMMAQSMQGFKGLYPAAILQQSGPDAPLRWSELVDQSAQDYEDPFQDLPPDQQNDIVMMISLEDRLESGWLPEAIAPRLKAGIEEKRKALEDAGVDIEWIVAQRWILAERRQKAALAANPDLHGQGVKIGGFIIPAPPSEDGRSTAYLVPQRGMCSHTPPPPPNQLLRLILNDGSDPVSLYEPVIVEGVLSMEQSRREIMVVDGMAMMWSSWTLETSGLTSALERPRSGKVKKETLPRRNR